MREIGPTYPSTERRSERFWSVAGLTAIHHIQNPPVDWTELKHPPWQSKKDRTRSNNDFYEVIAVAAGLHVDVDLYILRGRFFVRLQPV